MKRENNTKQKTTTHMKAIITRKTNMTKSLNKQTTKNTTNKQ